MNKSIVAAAALAALIIPAVVHAAPNAGSAKRQRAVQTQPQIACTILGCVPVPPGCGQRAGRDWDGNPNGLDVLVCPPGVQPFK